MAEKLETRSELFTSVTGNLSNITTLGFGIVFTDDGSNRLLVLQLHQQSTNTTYQIDFSNNKHRSKVSSGKWSAWTDNTSFNS